MNGCSNNCAGCLGMFNLALTETQKEVVAELQKAIEQIKAAAATVAVSVGLNVVSQVQSQTEQFVALITANTDLPRYQN